MNTWQARIIPGLATLVLVVGCNLTDDATTADGDNNPEAFDYAVPVLAPDACYVAQEGQSTTTDEAGVTVVQRVLRREPGICAQSMTEVVFSGRAAPENPGGKVVLQIVDPNGKILNTFSLR